MHEQSPTGETPGEAIQIALYIGGLSMTALMGMAEEMKEPTSKLEPFYGLRMTYLDLSEAYRADWIFVGKSNEVALYNAVSNTVKLATIAEPHADIELVYAETGVIDVEAGWDSWLAPQKYTEEAQDMRQFIDITATFGEAA